MALIGASGEVAPGLKPVRQAAIDRHVTHILSPSPTRQARGTAGLAKMNLAPHEQAYAQFKIQNSPNPQPSPQAPMALPPVIQTQHIAKMEQQAVNQYSDRLTNQAIKSLEKNALSFGFRASGDYAGGKTPMIDNRIVGLAHEYLGTPYVWGGSTPKGFDCSGFAQFIYGRVGINIPRTTYTQWTAKNGQPVSKRNLEPGDLVFFRGSDSKGGLPGHVGVYIGGGKMIDEAHTGTSARVESVWNFGGYMGARRYH